jgi:Spx/MgsR family transcriptional regulator
MKIYGIKTCDSVKKAFKYFKEKNIEYEFIDFKKTPADCNKIEEWLKKSEMEILFNKKGKKYRDLKLKDLNLDEKSKKEWLCKEYLLVKRPVIEYGDKLIIGFNEDKYNEIW